MPNHVKTVIKFSNDEDWKADKVFDAIKGENYEDGKERLFDFNKVVPMPDDVFRGDLSAKDEAAHPGEKNWYGWCPKYWGTKWNAYKVEREYDTLSFETAWSSPAPVIKKLSEMFPDYKMLVMYADEDIGSNCGAYTIVNGIVACEHNIGDTEVFAEALRS